MIFQTTILLSLCGSSLSAPIASANGLAAENPRNLNKRAPQVVDPFVDQFGAPIGAPYATTNAASLAAPFTAEAAAEAAAAVAAPDASTPDTITINQPSAPRVAPVAAAPVVQPRPQTIIITNPA